MIIGHLICAFVVATVATIMLAFNGVSLFILLLAFSGIGVTVLLATVVAEYLVNKYSSRAGLDISQKEAV